ncbi:MAG TPA: hypothetical protein PL045_11645, partial [Chitinophagaceae bacterium]|nr:hypothetical protein [Chitinophagaceae bacterium]
YTSDTLSEPADFTIAAAPYECAEILFKEYVPGNDSFDQDAPFYVRPVADQQQQEFTNETSVIVTHNLGYKPFVQVLDADDVLIGCTVTHDSNNQFTVTFDGATSGTIVYD